MKISPELSERARVVKENPQYRGQDLSDKIIIGLAAPFATGKSTVTDIAIELLQKRGIKAGIIGSEMTRPPRPGDPASYTTGIDPEELVAEGERGELINLTIHPTGHMYASNADSIPHDINISPLMPDSLRWFKEAGCKAVHAIYLTTTPEQWRKQIDERNCLAQEDTPKRIQEALDSLAIARRATVDDEVPLQFINNDGSRTPEQLAKSVLYLAGEQMYESSYRPLPDYAYDMHNYAIQLENEVRTA